MPPVTAKVPGNGTNTLTYTIPGAGMDVETVYVEVNGGGAAGVITGTLSIADQSGVVIAAKPQDDTMDASANVSATWALRLNDQSTAGSSAGGGTPSVATFRRSGGAHILTVAAGATVNLAWTQVNLPSDGSITGPTVGNVFVGFGAPCMTLEMLYTLWDDPGVGYLKAAVIGTDSRIIEADQFALGTAGAAVFDGVGQAYGDSTSFVRPNAHIATDLVHAYVKNGGAAAHDLLSAYLVVYAWPAPGYTGGIPGWPA